MDPSIMQLLEDDEDESMHSGADVEALSAALNRDIGGDVAAISQNSESDAGALLTQGTSSASKQILEHWQNSSQEETAIQQTQQQEEKQPLSSSEQRSSQDDVALTEPALETQVEQVSSQPENKQTKLDQEGSHSDNQEQQKQEDTVQSVENEQDKMSEKNVVEDSSTIQEESKQVIDHHPEDQQQQQQQQPQQQQAGNQSSGQQTESSKQANIAMQKAKATPSIPFHMLIPILRPHLDKDRSTQLQAVFTRLRNNEVSKEDFLRVIRNIVGDQMLRQAAHKVQMQLHAQPARNVQPNTNQFALDAQVSSQQIHEQQFQSPQLASSHGLKGARPPYAPSTGQTAEMQADSSSSGANGAKTVETENRLEGRAIRPAQHFAANMNMVSAERESSVIPLQAVNKQHQLPQSSFSMYGNTVGNFNAQAYPRPSLTSATPLRPHISPGGASLRSTQPMNVMNVPRYEPQNIGNETKRLHTGSLVSHSVSHHNSSAWQASTNKDQRSSGFPSMAYVKQEVVDQSSDLPSKSHITTTPESSSSGAAHVSGSVAVQVDQSSQFPQIGASTKTPPKKPSVGQKKPFEALGLSPPMSNKKQKTTGAFLDQSIEQLNDVTAVSGVNLREEEEQLLSAPKEDSRASEATRRVVQEEEDRLLLQRAPLQRKLEDIMLKCGLKSMSNDVLRCLSLCVEERLRGFVTHLVRLSKQRIDTEKTRHRFVITSDVRRQILTVNRKAKEEWDKKQAEEAEKLRKPNEAEANPGLDADKDKDREESRSKNVKANKEEDDKMRTTAANVAARAAVGGDDMLSKWQLMAEQARQKREGIDGASGKRPSTSISRREQQDSEKKSHSGAPVPGGTRKFNRNTQGVTNPKVPRSISVKDVINALEREPQMTKSTLVFRLYEKQSSSSAAE